MSFDFIEVGTGPALLFLPGSYSNHAAWKGVQAALSGSYRLISTSLPGYGNSCEVRPNSVSDMAEMTDFVARIVDHAKEPVHLIGHSYGGLAVLATALSKKAPLLSLLTFEANPVFIRPDDGDFPWLPEATAIPDRFEAAFAAGDPGAAAGIIDYWSAPGYFQTLPKPVQDYCRSCAKTNVLDWRTAKGFRPLLSDFAAIDIPATIVRGALANRAITDISKGIATHIPQGSLEVVRNANHFLISTHVKACAGVIDAHMDRFRAGAR